MWCVLRTIPGPSFTDEKTIENLRIPEHSFASMFRKTRETVVYHLDPQGMCKLLGNVCKEWRTIVNDTPSLVEPHH